jgi:hypothetical protein
MVGVLTLEVSSSLKNHAPGDTACHVAIWGKLTTLDQVSLSTGYCQGLPCHCARE